MHTMDELKMPFFQRIYKICLNKITNYLALCFTENSWILQKPPFPNIGSLKKNLLIPVSLKSEWVMSEKTKENIQTIIYNKKLSHNWNTSEVFPSLSSIICRWKGNKICPTVSDGNLIILIFIRWISGRNVFSIWL